MPTAVADSVALTGDARIDGLTQGGSWTFSGSRTLTYSFSLNTEPDDPTWASYSWLSSAITQAFSAWSNVANVSFVETGSGGSILTSTADIAIVIEDFGDPSVGGVGVFPDPDFANLFLGEVGYTRTEYPNPEGDVDFNITSSPFLIGAAPAGSEAFSILLHEIGHALGLKHPHDDGVNGRPLLPSAWDSEQYTVMSYNNVLGHVATPMLLDILAIQEIYGANSSHRTGDDTYALGSASFLSTIWDAAGIDTIDASTQWTGTSGVQIDLNEAGISGIRSNPPNGGTWIAHGAVIENAVGSSAGDLLIGNSAANTLSGLQGNHTLKGGAGADTLIGGLGDDIYIVMDSDLIIENANQGMDTVQSSALTFTLPSNVEKLELQGSGNISGTGNVLSNEITGNSGHNVLNGGGAVDILRGHGGDDTYVVSDQSPDKYLWLDSETLVVVNNVSEHYYADSTQNTVGTSLSYASGAPRPLSRLRMAMPGIAEAST